MPLLAVADRITVLTAEIGVAAELGPADLQAYLASHARQAEISTFRARGTEVAQGLLTGARQAGADVLVIGAYGHSRRRELIMGGVTEHIIDHTDLPVVMIH